MAQKAQLFKNTHLPYLLDTKNSSDNERTLFELLFDVFLRELKPIVVRALPLMLDIRVSAKNLAVARLQIDESLNELLIVPDPLTKEHSQFHEEFKSRLAKLNDANYLDFCKSIRLIFQRSH